MFEAWPFVRGFFFGAWAGIEVVLFLLEGPGAGTKLKRIQNGCKGDHEQPTSKRNMEENKRLKNEKLGFQEQVKQQPRVLSLCVIVPYQKDPNRKANSLPQCKKASR